MAQNEHPTSRAAAWRVLAVGLVLIGCVVAAFVAVHTVYRLSVATRHGNHETRPPATPGGPPATPGATNTPQTTIATATPPLVRSASLSGLHVVGNVLQNSSGQTVRLLGVNRSLESGCIGAYGQTPHFGDGNFDQASVKAMKSWGINTVRLNLNEDCWLGINEPANAAAYMGAAYRSFVISYTQLLNAGGIAADLDLHWTAPLTSIAYGQAAAPDADHALQFWSSMAGNVNFKNNPLVLYGAFNEPYYDDNNTVADWACWQYGSANASCTAAVAGVSYPIVGMQDIVNTIRATGAANVISLSGVRYADTLDYGETAKGFLVDLPHDPAHNLIAETHGYPGSGCNRDMAVGGCYDIHNAPTAATVPIVMGEMGEDDCSDQYINRAVPYLNSKGIGYLGYVWDDYGRGGVCQAGSGYDYELIASYDGTPIAPLGTTFKADLLAATGGAAPAALPTSTAPADAATATPSQTRELLP